MDKIPWGKILQFAKKAFAWYKRNKGKQQQQGPGGQGQQQQQGNYQGGQQNYGSSTQTQQQNQNYQPQQQQQQYQQNQNYNQNQQQVSQQQHQPPQQSNHQTGAHVNTDLLNAQNGQYVDLRNKGIKEGEAMARCSRESQEAFTRGDGEQAKKMSVQSKEHRRLKDVYNDQAANWIYNQNNKVQPNGSIDLHGLYVAESIHFAEKGITDSRNQGLQTLRIIVGKGSHSPDHVAKLGPAILEMTNKEHLPCHFEEGNNGVLVVGLVQGQSISGQRGVGKSIQEGAEEGCVVM